MPRITQFSSLRQTVGIASDVDWAQLGEIFCDAVKDPFAGDSHPGWSAAEFKDNRRLKKNVTLIHAVVLDYDGETESIDAISRRWSQFAHIAHTTKSNASADRHCCRVILPTTRPMTAAEFDRIWACVQAVEPTIDVATRDASRFWYWPGSQHPQYARYVIALGGRRIDPDADFVSQPLARAVAAIHAAPPGQRNHTLNSQAFAVARQLHAAPAALETLATAARAAGLDEREISRTIQSATTAVQRPQSTDDAHVFDRGDHVEIADRIQAIMPPLAHDGLQFYAYDAGVWRALHVSQIAMTVHSLAFALVRSQSGAVRKLNMTSGMIDGVQKILAGRAYRDFSAAPAGVTFRNTRLAIHDGAVY